MNVVQQKISSLYGEGFIAVPPRESFSLGDYFVKSSKGRIIKVGDLELIRISDESINILSSPRLDTAPIPEGIDICYNATRSLQTSSNFEIGPQGLPIAGTTTLTYSFHKGQSVILKCLRPRRVKLYDSSVLAASMSRNRHIITKVQAELKSVQSRGWNLISREKRFFIITEIIQCEDSYFTIQDYSKEEKKAELTLSVAHHANLSGKINVVSEKMMKSKLTATGSFVVGIKIEGFVPQNVELLFTALDVQKTVSAIRMIQLSTVEGNEGDEVDFGYFDARSDEAENAIDDNTIQQLMYLIQQSQTIDVVDGKDANSNGVCIEADIRHEALAAKNGNLSESGKGRERLSVLSRKKIRQRSESKILVKGRLMAPLKRGKTAKVEVISHLEALVREKLLVKKKVKEKKMEKKESKIVKVKRLKKMEKKESRMKM